jgi:hypothetical protein
VTGATVTGAAAAVRRVTPPLLSVVVSRRPRLSWSQAVRLRRIELATAASGRPVPFDEITMTNGLPEEER